MISENKYKGGGTFTSSDFKFGAENEIAKFSKYSFDCLWFDEFSQPIPNKWAIPVFALRLRLFQPLYPQQALEFLWATHQGKFLTRMLSSLRNTLWDYLTESYFLKAFSIFNWLLGMIYFVEYYNKCCYTCPLAESGWVIFAAAIHIVSINPFRYDLALNCGVS